MSGRGQPARKRRVPKLREIRAIRDASILRLWRGWDDDRRPATTRKEAVRRTDR